VKINEYKLPGCPDNLIFDEKKENLYVSLVPRLYDFVSIKSE
jgi:hypothetical protein